MNAQHSRPAAKYQRTLEVLTPMGQPAGNVVTYRLTSPEGNVQTKHTTNDRKGWQAIQALGEFFGYQMFQTKTLPDGQEQQIPWAESSIYRMRKDWIHDPPAPHAVEQNDTANAGEPQQ